MLLLVFSPMYYCFEHYGWHNTLVLLSAVFFIIVLLMWINKIPEKHHSFIVKNNLWDDIKTIISKKPVWVNALAVGCFYVLR